MKPHDRTVCLSIGLWAFTASETLAADIGTGITYQGVLTQAGATVDGTCSIRFSLWDALVVGTQQGPMLEQTVSVADGLFTAPLDFGDQFSGDARWLQIAVCCPSPCGAFSVLNPRQELTSAPYALRALSGVGGPGALHVDSVTGHVTIGATPDPVEPRAAGDTLNVNGTMSTTQSVRIGRSSSGLCITPGGSDCCVAHDGGGCDDVECASLVFPMQPECQDDWTEGCAEVAIEQCGICGATAAAAGFFLVRVNDDFGVEGSTNGEPLIRVKANGQFGIGTDAPQSDLHVQSRTSLASFLLTPSAGNQGSEIVLSEDSGASNAFILRYDGTAAANPVHFLGRNGGAEASPYLTIERNGGNVGIGTTDPSARLHLAQLGVPTLRLQDLGAGGPTYHVGIASDDTFRIAETSVGDRITITRTTGNVGIGTTAPANKLDVEGGAAIGATYSGTNAAPANGLIVQGNIGIGTPSPSAALDVVGASKLNGALAVDTSTLTVDATNKRVGIGTTAPANKLDVEGSAVIGANYSGTSIAPTNGLIVQGNVGIGTPSPTEELTVAGTIESTAGGFKFPNGSIQTAASFGDITAVSAGGGLTGGGTSGSVSIAANFAGNGAATTIARSDHSHSSLNAADGSPTNSVSVDNDGNVGIGTPDATNRMDVAGGAVIGATYSGTNAAPTNGLLVEGRVGIGTTDPTARLHVAGTAGVDGIRFPDGSLQTAASLGDITGVTAGNGLSGGGTSGTVSVSANFGGNGAATTVARSDHYHSSLNAADGSPTNALTIDNDGDVGIGTGTASPENRLHVFKGSAGLVTAHNDAPLVVESDLTTYLQILTLDANERGILFGETSNNVAGGIIYNNPATPDGLQLRTGGNNTRMVIRSDGNVGIGTSNPGRPLVVNGEAQVDGTVFAGNGFSSIGGDLLLKTDGTTRILVDDATGNFGIGGASPSYKLYVAGSAGFFGNVCSTVGFNVCSDARYKNNVHDISNSLDTIRSLRGVRFDWRHDEFPDRRFNDRPQVGFIAQEVEPVLPEAVSKEIDGYYSVDYGRLTPVLVEAVKELHDIVREKDARITALEARLTAMETAMAALAQKSAENVP